MVRYGPWKGNEIGCCNDALVLVRTRIRIRTRTTVVASSVFAWFVFLS